MKLFKQLIKTFLYLSAVTLFVGCGAEDKADNGTIIVNERPVAEASYDVLIAKNSNVSFSGADSIDADGDTVTYEWQQISGPTIEGSSGIFTGEEITFIAPDSVGTMVFELTVHDGQDSSEVLTFYVNVVEQSHATFFVDGDLGNNDTGNGSLQQPFASISKALCEVTFAQQDIYVKTRADNGIYEETTDSCPSKGIELWQEGDDPRPERDILKVPTGTSLYGGYDNSWVRDVDANKTMLSTTHYGVIFEYVNADAWFSGFDLMSADTLTADISVFGLSALGGSALMTVEDNVIAAGDVGPGVAELAGTSYGLRIALIEAAFVNRNIISSGLGGAGENLALTYAQSAKSGTDGGDGSGRTGGVKGIGGGSSSSNGTNGGTGGNVYGNGSNGANGSLGATGSNGTLGSGAQGYGWFTHYDDGGFYVFYNPADGNKGASGAAGDGGTGGGGGGGGVFPLLEVGGGGGGGGGAGGGGSGGDSGPGGGASIAVFLIDITTVVDITNNVIISNQGGDGGSGGYGQIGGAKGNGGSGAAGSCTIGLCAGDGGNGGDGGLGGDGGRGGAGAGGPSIGIAIANMAHASIIDNQISSGQGGIGGFGGNGNQYGHGGNGGYSYCIFDFYLADGLANTLTNNVATVGEAGLGGSAEGSGIAGYAGSSDVKNW